MKFSGIIYLDNDIIIEIHKLQLEEHGGLAGVRDQGGLESAIAQPKASFGEEELSDLFRAAWIKFSYPKK